MYKQIKTTLVALAICVAPMSAYAGAPGSMFVDEDQKELLGQAIEDHAVSRDSYSSTGYTYSEERDDDRHLIMFTTPKTPSGAVFYIQTDQLVGGRTKTTVGLTNLFTYNYVFSVHMGSVPAKGDASYFGDDTAKMDDFLLGLAAAVREYRKNSSYAEPIPGSYPMSTAGTNWCNVGCLIYSGVGAAMGGSSVAVGCTFAPWACGLIVAGVGAGLGGLFDQQCKAAFDCEGNPRPSTTSEPRPNHGG